MLGTLVAQALHAGFNSVGAHLVALALFLTALFLTTPFSFTGTHANGARAVEKAGPDRPAEGALGRMARGARAGERRQTARDQSRCPGGSLCRHKPFAASRSLAGCQLEAQRKNRGGRRATDPTVAEPVLVLPRDAGAADPETAEQERARRPQDLARHHKLPAAFAGPAAHGRAQRKNAGRRTEGVRARHRGKVPGIRRRRARHADQSRPGRHHLRVQARSGHQIQPHHRPGR